jgi:hypothetical protein
MKTYLILKNGTYQGEIEAKNIKEARGKVFSTYGEEREVYEQKIEPLVACFIYDKFQERGVKAFEKKVTKLLKENGIDGEFICQNAYMKGQGRGSYLKFADISVNGEIINLAEHTHDSQLWDSWENPTSKDKRNMFLAVLESQIETLKEYINEN